MSRKISLSDSVTRNSTVLSADIDGEVVLLNMDNGRYYGLDDIASEIWQMLSTSIEIEDLCTILAASYHADRATVTDDIVALLEQFQEQDLIAIVTHDSI